MDNRTSLINRKRDEYNRRIEKLEDDLKIEIKKAEQIAISTTGDIRDAHRDIYIKPFIDFKNAEVIRLTRQLEEDIDEIIKNTPSYPAVTQPAPAQTMNPNPQNPPLSSQTGPAEPTHSQNFYNPYFLVGCKEGGIDVNLLINEIKGLQDPDPRNLPPGVQELEDNNGNQIKSKYGDGLYTYNGDNTKIFTYPEVIKEYISSMYLRTRRRESPLERYIIDEVYDLDIDKIKIKKEIPPRIPSMFNGYSVEGQCQREGYDHAKIAQALAAMSVTDPAVANAIEPLKDENGAPVNPTLTGGVQVYCVDGDQGFVFNKEEAIKEVFYNAINHLGLEGALDKFHIPLADVRINATQNHNNQRGNDDYGYGTENYRYKDEFDDVVVRYIRGENEGDIFDRALEIETKITVNYRSNAGLHTKMLLNHVNKWVKSEIEAIGNIRRYDADHRTIKNKIYKEREKNPGWFARTWKEFNPFAKEEMVEEYKPATTIEEAFEDLITLTTKKQRSQEVHTPMEPRDGGFDSSY
jgi:hypothetical protein